MPSEGIAGDRRQPTRPQQGPTEPGNLPCPRCDSTNTKFCYYNNYNLSQPRYFCKSCRRYWTRGGSFRNIPVGGGSRRNSKRSRSSTAATATPPPQQPTPAAVVKPEIEIPSPLRCDLNLNEASFTSLLTTFNDAAPHGGAAGSDGSGGFMGILCGNGLGLSGFEDMGFGFGASENRHVGESGGENVGGDSWQFGGFDSSGTGGGGGGVVDGGDYFAWPDLAISTSGKGLQ